MNDVTFKHVIVDFWLTHFVRGEKNIWLVVEQRSANASVRLVLDLWSAVLDEGGQLDPPKWTFLVSAVI